MLDPMRPGQHGQPRAVCKILAFDVFEKGEKNRFKQILFLQQFVSSDEHPGRV